MVKFGFLLSYLAACQSKVLISTYVESIQIVKKYGSSRIDVKAGRTFKPSFRNGLDWVY